MLGSLGAKHVVCGAAVTCPARSPPWPPSSMLSGQGLIQAHVCVTQQTTAHAFKTILGGCERTPLFSTLVIFMEIYAHPELVLADPFHQPVKALLISVVILP